MIIRTGVRTETLTALGATVRRYSCSNFSTQDQNCGSATYICRRWGKRPRRPRSPRRAEQAAAAIAKTGVSTVFARRSETLEEYWWYIEQMMTIPGADGCDQLVVDGGGDPIHEGKEAEEKYESDESLSFPTTTDNVEQKVSLQVLKGPIP